MKKILITAALTAMSVLSFAASATVITFDSFDHVGTGSYVPPIYSENSFTLHDSFNYGFLATQQDNTSNYFGSTGLMAGEGARTILMKDGGSTFNFNSIDLAPAATGPWGADATATFIGNVHGGGTVTASFTLNNSYAFQTFSFAGFNNLDSVSWEQDYLHIGIPDFKTTKYYQFDNITLDVVSPVPEPATYAMLLAGLGLLGFAALRRNNSPCKPV